MLSQNCFLLSGRYSVNILHLIAAVKTMFPPHDLKLPLDSSHLPAWGFSVSLHFKITLEMLSTISQKTHNRFYYFKVASDNTKNSEKTQIIICTVITIRQKTAHSLMITTGRLMINHTIELLFSKQYRFTKLEVGLRIVGLILVSGQSRTRFKNHKMH